MGLTPPVRHHILLRGQPTDGLDCRWRRLRLAYLPRRRTRWPRDGEAGAGRAAWRSLSSRRFGSDGSLTTAGRRAGRPLTDSLPPIRPKARSSVRLPSFVVLPPWCRRPPLPGCGRLGRARILDCHHGHAIRRFVVDIDDQHPAPRTEDEAEVGPWRLERRAQARNA